MLENRSKSFLASIYLLGLLYKPVIFKFPMNNQIHCNFDPYMYEIIIPIFRIFMRKSSWDLIHVYKHTEGLTMPESAWFW